MGWIPCSGSSNTKKKLKKKLEKMEAQNSLVDPIKTTPGSDVVDFVEVGCKIKSSMVWDNETPLMRLVFSPRFLLFLSYED